MYWKRCSPNATTLTTRGTTLNVQLRLQLSSTKTRTPFASPRKRHLLSRARRGRSRASKRINRAFVLRSARDEALLEETLRFNRVAARTDLTLAQALSLGVLVVPMLLMAASPTRPRRARCSALSAALQGEQPEGPKMGFGKRTRDLKVMLAALALMRAILGAAQPRGSVLHVLSAETAPLLSCGLNTRALQTRRCDDYTTMDTYNKLHRDHVVA